MKITLTGSLGKIGQPLTEQLVTHQHEVTLISTDAGKKKDIKDLGAIAAIGSLEDVDFLSRTFTGADIVYCMAPPANYMDPNVDIIGYHRRLGNHFAEAIRRSGVKRAIHLSSVGGQLPQGTGPILGHHEIETILDGLTGVDITFVRPVAIYYNLYGFLHGIKQQGKIAANYGGDDVVAWVAPADIAAAVTEEMEAPAEHRRVRYAASDELSCNETARILGEAIGKPDLTWTIIPDEEMEKGLETFGLAPEAASGLTEMQASMHTGVLFENYEEHRPAMGKVKMKDFAKEFAAAYSQQ